MFATKIRRVGKSNFLIISIATLAVLDVKESDTVYIAPSDDNCLKIHARDTAVLAALAAAKEVIDGNRSLLQAPKSKLI